jgi:pantoate--beta-alanine ligase
MLRDLDLGVEIVGAPIVRDGDGLALSSRNAYLSADERGAALALPRSLQDAAAQIEAGVNIGVVLDQAKTAILQAGFASVDYVALVDAASLEPIEVLDKEARILAAARMGSTRLIDNFPVRTKK